MGLTINESDMDNATDCESIDELLKQMYEFTARLVESRVGRLQ